MEPTMSQQPQSQKPTSNPEDAIFWCTHALHNVFRDTAMPTGDVGTLKLFAARNQTVGGQIVIRAGTVPVRVGQLRCDGIRSEDGTATIRGENFSWAFIEYFHVEKNSTLTPTQELARTAPADFPDAFSEAREITVPANMNQPIWVQFRVPANARPGTYVGMVRGVVDNDELQVPVSLTVYDFALPSATRLFVTVWVDLGALERHQQAPIYSQAWWDLIDRVAAIMQAHHQNVILTPWTLIRARKTASGKPELDFERFDRWVRIFLSRGFKRIEIAHVGGREHGQWEDKTFVASEMACESPEGAKLSIEEWLPLLQAHLEDMGWLERCMIHVADEPIEVNLQSWKELSNRVRRAAPQLRRIDAVHVPDLAGALEVWVPQLNYLEQWLPKFKAAQQKGAELWYYTAWVPQGRYPNRLMDFPLIKTRMLHWINYTSGTTGYLHWGWNFWDVRFDQFAPGDNWIVWPGTKSPRSSIRYEAMREGIEDYEYLCLLEDAVRKAARATGAKDLDPRAFVLRFAAALAPTFQDYSRNPAVLFSVRNSVARAIESLGRPLPTAILATKVGGDAELSGFAPPGAVLRIGETQAVAGEDGSFTLAITPARDPLEVTIVLDGRTETVNIPLVVP